MAATFDGHGEPADGDTVEVDCSIDGEEGVVRA
jgi:hypothetical protein